MTATIIFYIFLLGCIFPIFLIYNKFSKKGMGNWIIPYLHHRKKSGQNNKLTHIMFCVADHYEPFHGGADFEEARRCVAAWSKGYPAMANHFTDADGKHPQHTWFYPPHLDHRFLNDLVEMCLQGYGEIEMHLHHNRMQPFPDTSMTLKNKILKCIEDYSQWGIFCLPDGSKKYAFVHGDWSLDNAAGSKICGVNNEIQILKETGCFADFTFPAINTCQPKMVNCIYYAKDDPQRPKSYNNGIEVTVHGEPSDFDLMMVTGPIGLRSKKWKGKLTIPAIESGSFGKINRPAQDRIDFWIQQGICVKGKPEWILVKLHTHGGPGENHDVNLGATAEKMYDYLCTKYNDGQNYSLHFVTAREMYNVIKAAEAGMNGNPNAFRNYIIPEYTYKKRG